MASGPAVTPAGSPAIPVDPQLEDGQPGFVGERTQGADGLLGIHRFIVS